MDDNPKSFSGRKAEYFDQYTPKVLQAVKRDQTHNEVAINPHALPFQGIDIWNDFDFTWLNMQGNPEYAMLSIYIPSNSISIVESKSLKLYLYSFANSKFQDANEIIQILQQDLSKITNSTLQIKLKPQITNFMQIAAHFAGANIDNNTINCSAYALQTDFLQCGEQVVTEQLCSDLLQIMGKNNKPDWASLRISYTGPQINQDSLLKYIVSYRKHPIMPEHCIDRMYYDILQFCKPKTLTIEGAFTRRGSIDLYAVRSSESIKQDYERLFRH